MKYKMLVLDIDDTLLTDDHQISAQNKKAIKQAQEAGIMVVLASGRPTIAMIEYANELELDKHGSYIISFNGAIITCMRSKEIIFEQSLTPNQIHNLHDFSLENNLHIITYKEDEIVSETNSKYIDIEIELTGMSHQKVDCFKKAINQNAVKCILLDDPSQLKLAEPKLKERFPNLSIAISKPFFLEVMPKGIDKATSIERLAKKHQINREEIIAVGNAHNDLTMIEYAGLGVWVDNVTDDLRHLGDVIVASNNNHGVSQVIEQYILQQNNG